MDAVTWAGLGAGILGTLIGVIAVAMGVRADHRSQLAALAHREALNRIEASVIDVALDVKSTVNTTYRQMVNRLTAPADAPSVTSADVAAQDVVAGLHIALSNAAGETRVVDQRVLEQLADDLAKRLRRREAQMTHAAASMVSEVTAATVSLSPAARTLAMQLLATESPLTSEQHSAVMRGPLGDALDQLEEARLLSLYPASCNSTSNEYWFDPTVESVLREGSFTGPSEALAVAVRGALQVAGVPGGRS